MISLLRAPASGMVAQQLAVDVVANNLANVNTPGFESSRVSFQDLIYQPFSLVGQVNPGTVQSAPQSVQVGAGVQTSGTERVLIQGNLQPDGNPLHMAIEGDGYFVIQMPDGSAAYTRDGTFQLDANRRLVTEDGNYLVPNITIPSNASSVRIDPSGVVYAQIDSSGQTVQVGTVQLARFGNPNGLLAIGHNLFRATPESGGAVANVPGQGGYGTVIGGALESSNVDLATEMTNLLMAQRAYQLDVRSLQTIDQMLSLANSLRQ